MDGIINQNTDEFNIRDIFNIIYNNLIKIIVISLLFGVSSYFITKYYIPEVYEANAKMIVNRDSAQEKTDTPFSYSDALLTAKLVETYSIILTSDTLLEKVIAELEMQDMTPGILRGKISATGIKDTDVLSISVRDHDRNLAANIANKILDLAPDEITRTVEAGSVKTIDSAKVPQSPVQPNVMINTAIAALLGGVIVIAFGFLKEYLDDTVKSDEQIRMKFNIPVLGMLPEVQLDNND